MIPIERTLIKYICPVTTLDVTHHILIANTIEQKILLSHPNLFLYEKARFSKETSNRYSSVISKFYKFMSDDDNFKDVHVSQYHAVADNAAIKRWQVDRMKRRVYAQKLRPTTKTITEDAIIVATFFDWIRKAGYVTNVNIEEKETYFPNWKSDEMLSYIKKRPRKKNDMKSFIVLDKESRQKRLHSLITGKEIQTLSQSYNDPVYPALFKLALDTGMRPMDLCQFPYIGSGKNWHIMPYSDMNNDTSLLTDFTVKSKLNKTRTLKIPLKTLKYIEEFYIKPLYYKRAAKYEKKFNKKCPTSILFLSDRGVPVTPTMISSRTYDAKIIAKERYPKFRENVTFYHSRHWWPTMFLINTFKDKLLTADADVLYAAVSQVIIEQLGHENIQTTYKHYIDSARFYVLALKGYVNEIFKESDKTVCDFINYIEEELDG